MARTVTDQFADILVTAGVKRSYGIVGDSLNGLTDSLRRHGQSDGAGDWRAGGLSVQQDLPAKVVVLWLSRLHRDRAKLFGSRAEAAQRHPL